MRITEGQLRKIIREEARRVMEVAPGVMAPLGPDMTGLELAELMQSVEYGVNEYIKEMYAGEDEEIIADIMSDPSARENAFYENTQAVDYLREFEGKSVGGLEEITDGSAVATIAAFEYNPAIVTRTGNGITAYLTTDHGEIEVTLDDLAGF